jgi:hypothetical protein
MSDMKVDIKPKKDKKADKKTNKVIKPKKL